jgi:hypothetical protein
MLKSDASDIKRSKRLRPGVLKQTVQMLNKQNILQKNQIFF